MTSAEPFELCIFFRENPVATWEDARSFVETLVREAKDLAPTAFRETHDRSEPLTLEAVERAYKKKRATRDLWFANEQGVTVSIVWFEQGRDPGGRLQMWIPPALAAGRGETTFGLALTLCRMSAPLYGWGHPAEDVRAAKEPSYSSTWAPKQVHQLYWLTILGAPIVKQLGKTKVAATPAHRVEILKSGAALVVTTPDPADATTPAGRAAQAKATAHLRPDVDEKKLLEALLARGGAATPAAAAAAPAAEPSEWIAAADALASDVDDAKEAVRRYTNDAEDYIAGFHDEVRNLIDEDASSLEGLDEHFEERDYWTGRDVTELERKMVPYLGAYVGRMLVRELGGRWVPRKNLEETQVVAGDRAWLPFLRAKHFIRSRDAARAHSWRQFFAAAKKHAGKVISAR